MLTGFTDAKKNLQRRLTALRQDRNRFVPHWKEIQDYLLPDHGRGLAADYSGKDEDLDGEKKQTYILDSEGTHAVDICAAGFQAGLTRPSSPWFKLGLHDKILTKKQPVAKWLYDCEQILMAVFSNTAAYTTFHHTYMEMIGFGTGCYGMFEDFDRLIHFRPYTVGEYFAATDSKGAVNTIYREVWLTALQLAEEFGLENCSRAVQNSLKNGGTENRFRIIHAVEPNDDRIEVPNIGGKKWRSVYYEERGDEDKLLRVRGYNSFPFIVPRWFTVGNQVYGRNSPGMRMLPDIKQLQIETKKKLEAIDKVVDPPTLVPGRPTDLQINSFPGGITYDTTPGSSQGNGVRPLYEVRPDINAVVQDIDKLQLRIKIGMFNDLFLAMLGQQYGQPMTAREVAERHEEKMLMIGPVIERANIDMLSPTIERGFAMAEEADILPPPPEDIQGMPLHVEFIGIFAQAQKMAGIGAVEQFVGFVGSMAGAKPEVLDKLDFDAAVEIYGERAGVPPSIIVDDRDVAATRARRAQQQAAQQAIQQGAVAAQAANVMAKTDTGGNTVLSTLMGALPGGQGGR